MDARTNLDYRFAEPRDVRAVLRAYWEWFDAAQRMRTVAQSPFLFRYFHKREMRAGRCSIAVADDPWRPTQVVNPLAERTAGDGRGVGEKVALRQTLHGAERLKVRGPVCPCTPTGTLTREAVADAKLIIEGGRLRNPTLIRELTADGGSISDWGKSTTRTWYDSPSGPYQPHFHVNSKNGLIFYGMDYKSVFRHPFLP